MQSAGKDISYIRSTFAPSDGRRIYLFDAESDTEVRLLNDNAKLPYFQVIEAFDLTP